MVIFHCYVKLPEDIFGVQSLEVLVAQAYTAPTVGGTKLPKLALAQSRDQWRPHIFNKQKTWHWIHTGYVYDMFMVNYGKTSKFSRFPTSLQLPSSCRMTFTSTLTSRHKQSQTQLLDSGLNGCNCEQGIALTSLGCNATAAFCKQ